jgi:hypothetical protein
MNKEEARVFAKSLVNMTKAERDTKIDALSLDEQKYLLKLITESKKFQEIIDSLSG